MPQSGRCDRRSDGAFGLWGGTSAEALIAASGASIQRKISFVSFNNGEVAAYRTKEIFNGLGDVNLGAVVGGSNGFGGGIVISKSLIQKFIKHSSILRFGVRAYGLRR